MATWQYQIGQVAYAMWLQASTNRAQ